MSQQVKQPRRTRLVSIIAAAALVGASLIGVAIWQGSQADDDAAMPADVSAAGDGLPVGDGPATVEIYLDFLCPACRAFDEAARPLLESYLADGTITLIYHPIAILNRASTTEYSTRAAGAAGCAADEGRIDEFVGVMMERQPAEGGAGYSDDEIVEIGESVGLAGSGFGECVSDGRYRDWAETSTDAAADRGVSGTPTVFIDGSPHELTTLESLAGAIEAAAAA